MSELREQAERAGQGLDVEALISARMEQVARAENAEAAIARVRKLCDDFEHEENLNGGIGRYAVVRVDRVRSALNGERDE